jgi:hypothetical protein
VKPRVDLAKPGKMSGHVLRNSAGVPDDPNEFGPLGEPHDSPEITPNDLQQLTVTECDCAAVQRPADHHPQQRVTGWRTIAVDAGFPDRPKNAERLWSRNEKPESAQRARLFDR